jgi:hypothetical protein
VPITTAIGRVQDDPLFLNWMARDRSLTLALLVESNAELRCVYTTACRFHERLTALTLCLSVRGLDVTLAAMLLRDLPRVCPSLRSIELIDSFDNSVWVTLHDLLEAAPVAVQSHPVRAFAMVLRQNVLPREAIPIIAQWLPCLESLTVRPYSAGRFATDDARLGLILEAFPRLEALALREVSLTPCCDLLDAYETRGCRIRTLSVTTASPTSHFLKHSPVRPDGSLRRYASWRCTLVHQPIQPACFQQQRPYSKPTVCSSAFDCDSVRATSGINAMGCGSGLSDSTASRSVS